MTPKPSVIAMNASDDIFSSGAFALVVPVNCVGVAGAGLAREVARRFPHWEHRYKHDCRFGRTRPGHTAHYITGDHHPALIVSFPTKRHWRDTSRLDDIHAGLDHLGRWAKEAGLPSIAVPALGCGLGGLEWDNVYPMIVAKLCLIDGLTTYLYPPR